ncbi:hypothetical protein Bca4012_028744 [Brassica carinata]
MEVVLNFTGVVDIEFAGAVELGSYILYPVKNVCSSQLRRDEDGAQRGSIFV